MLLRAPVFFQDSEVRVTGRRHVSGEGAIRDSSFTAHWTYSFLANRAYLRSRQITAVIPVNADHAANRREKGSRGGRPRPSTPSATRSAIPSNAASTSCASTAPSPRRTTCETASARVPSKSLPSASGCATRSPDPRNRHTGGLSFSAGSGRRPGRERHGRLPGRSAPRQGRHRPAMIGDGARPRGSASRPIRRSHRSARAGVDRR